MFAAMMAAAGLSMLHVVPRPAAITALSCRSGDVAPPNLAGAPLEAIEEIRERWPLALNGGVGPLRSRIDPALGPQAYRLEIDDRGTALASGSSDGAYYGLMTLGQLAMKNARGVRIPCVRIVDAPALRWRILSDDVSRGPLPVRTYFERRIRIAAAYKMNGYSPYMEHVFASPTDPLPALGTSPDGISPDDLRHLAAYARRFHMTLVPQQQTFAHMHGTLRVERYAALAEFPHGYLLAPNQPASMAYLARVIAQERAAVGQSPFFHIGSDETATLGEGQTAAYVSAAGGRSAAFAQHVTALSKLVAPSRAMVWDDGIQSDPSILGHIPRDVVVIDWHYDDRPTYRPFIDTIANAGFDQMVAPGANNWNEIFPALNVALNDERRFIDEGKQARVLGLFQTVWHDDGETLYEVTWPAVLYAAAAAWEQGDVEPERFLDDAARSFYGRDTIAGDVRALARIESVLGGNTDKMFWTDPFDPLIGGSLSDAQLRAVRLDAESVQQDLRDDAGDGPGLRALRFTAQRFDALVRRFQIAREVRGYYADAAAHPNDAVRDLFWCKYLFWEMRDTDMELAAALEPVWRTENGTHHLASVFLRYQMDAERAIRRADAIDRITYAGYLHGKHLPPLESVLPQ